MIFHDKEAMNFWYTIFYKIIEILEIIIIFVAVTSVLTILFSYSTF